jgi:hypothetical protein
MINVSTMKQKLSLTKLKAHLSLKTTRKILSRWRYCLLALLVAIVMFELLYWMLNLKLFSTLMFSPALGVSDRFWLLTDPLREVFTNNGMIVGISIVLLSLIQGVTIAVIVFSVRNSKNGMLKSFGGASAAGLLGALGLGCPSCGTSLITPIVALFVSGSTVSIAQGIARIVMPLSVVIGAYALYVAGTKASTALVMVESDNASRSV